MLTDEEGAGIREFLGGALDGPEPPLRDLASGSIVRGDAARRRTRVYSGAGVALAAVAVLGVFAATSALTPPGRHSPTKPLPTPAPTQATLGHADKLRDIDARLPVLLQALLPPGMTLQTAPDEFRNGSGGILTLVGAAGPNLMQVQAQKADGHLASDDAQACTELLPNLAGPGRSCTTVRTVGGRLFSGELDGDVKSSLAGFPDDAFKPGMARATYVKNYWYAFAPDQVGQRIVTLTLTAQTMDIPWAAKTPKDWPVGYAPYAPNVPRVVPLGNDPDGALLTSGQFAAMLAEPGWDEIGQLLDPTVPPAPSALALRDTADEQIASKVGAMLPAGTQLVLSPDDGRPGSLELVGPTGTNGFMWFAEQSAPTLRAHYTQAGLCVVVDETCSVTTVAGGRLAVVTRGKTQTTVPASYEYDFVPDDPNAPIYILRLTSDSPGFVASGPLLTADQFLSLVRTAGFGDAMQGVTALVSAL